MLESKYSFSSIPVWVELANAIEQVECENQISPLTSGSSDTDYTASSIAMSFPEKREILQHYEQRPEKIPNVAAEMEKWYALTDRYGFLEKDSLHDDST
ncbi:hypothetical protein G6F56_013480 [Rhizopus delemar]|nr:hypothetical protein G6F56_013480 [Rhizopus delemar]